MHFCGHLRSSLCATLPTVAFVRHALPLPLQSLQLPFTSILCGCLGRHCPLCTIMRTHFKLEELPVLHDGPFAPRSEHLPKNLA